MAVAETEAVANTDLVVCVEEVNFATGKETEHKALEEPGNTTAESSVDVSETQKNVPDNKRKLEDLEPFNDDEALAKKQEICAFDVTKVGLEPNTQGLEGNTGGPVSTEDQASAEFEAVASDIATEEMEGHPTMENRVAVDDGTMVDSAHGASPSIGNSEKQLFQKDKPDGIDLIHLKVVEENMGNGQVSSSSNTQRTFMKDTQYPSSSSLQDGLSLPISDDLSSLTLKIDVPNDKVGVLIGKYGETIKHLQINSGAKIQITRDTDVDPYSSTRTVELIGTPESVSKADQLIKNVIAEAEAGGSPALVAKGFGALQSGDAQTEIQVLNEMVGKIIGKGGETIKNVQTKSGARVQLIPQHLLKGDSSKERTVRITGSQKQVDFAKEMIMDVINQVPSRTSSTFRPPYGSTQVTQWGPRSSMPTHQTLGYNHHQRGMYPPTQYHQPYGGYLQQPPPRGAYGSGWVQPRPTASPMQPGPQPGGYDYYNQGGPAHHNQPANPVPGPAPSFAPPPTNSNYYQSQSPDVYGQQRYGQGYNNEPKYDNQPFTQQMGPHPGMYGTQSATQGKPAYDATRMANPGDQMYQGTPQNQYPSNAPMQQQYPYASNAPPVQQEPSYNQQAYGPISAPTDGYSGYSQPSQPGQPGPGYAQAGQPAPAYGQPMPAYGQSVPASGQPIPQPVGYNQYPSQPSYGDQPAQYQGSVPDATYTGSVPNTGYAAQPPVTGIPPYTQPPVNPSSYYDQPVPSQYGGGGAPLTAVAPAAAGAPTAYTNNVTPQPGYGGQYDSGQAYTHQ